MTHGAGQTFQYILQMFSDFKIDYSLEMVNEYLCTLLRKYKVETGDRRYRYNNSEFSVYVEYNYSDRFYATNEIFDYDFEDEEIIIPSINGVSLYFTK